MVVEPVRRLDVASVEDEVYRRLRDDISELTLAPGRRLPLEELAAGLGVSMTPVRQALRRLESEGWVESERHRGARVAPLTLAELEEAQAIRLGVEGYLARLGASACTDEALAEMESHNRANHDALRVRDGDAFLRSAWAMRSACYRCAGRPRLERIAEEQRLRVRRYIRHLSGEPGRLVFDHRGFEPLLEACRARDGEAAEAETRESLLFVLEDYSRALERVREAS